MFAIKDREAGTYLGYRKYEWTHDLDRARLFREQVVAQSALEQSRKLNRSASQFNKLNEKQLGENVPEDVDQLIIQEVEVREL